MTSNPFIEGAQLTPGVIGNGNGESAKPELIRFTKVIGTRGLKNLGGRVQEEYLRSLQSWEVAVRVFLEMQDDPTVATLLWAIKLPLLSADFDVTPHSDSLVDSLAADFVWDNITKMDRQSWRSHVNDSLEAVDFGFYVGEIVMEKRADGKLWLKNIDPRGQETLNRWEFDEHDNTTAFIQIDPDTGQLIRIPIEKTVHITHLARKGNPQGKSLLRSVYRPWKFLKELENFEGIGLERNVGGMPVATLPPEPLTEQDLTDLKEALRNLRLDEEMYLVLPSDVAVQPYSGQTSVAQISDVINRKQQEILMRGFAQFLKLGMDKVGTQALVRGSQDFFALSLRSIQQEWLEIWNRQLIPYLFRFNPNSFPGLSGYPQLTWSDPGKVDLDAIVNIYGRGKSAGIITATREDEEHVRAIADLPDLPEGEGEGPRGEIETPMPTPGLLGMPRGAGPALNPFSEYEFKGPPRPGLIPASGDPEHPYRWIRPEELKDGEGGVPTPTTLVNIGGLDLNDSQQMNKVTKMLNRPLAPLTAAEDRMSMKLGGAVDVAAGRSAKTLIKTTKELSDAGVDPNAITPIMRRWSDPEYHQQILEESKRTLAGEGDPGSDGFVLTTLAINSKPNVRISQELWRGLSVPGGPGAVESAFQPGQQLDLPLTSFSEEYGRAESYARAKGVSERGIVREGYPVVVKLRQGLGDQTLSLRLGMDVPDEWLAIGRVEVERIDKPSFEGEPYQVVLRRQSSGPPESVPWEKTPEGRAVIEAELKRIKAEEK